MKPRLLEVAIKIFLGVFELFFVGYVCSLRLEGIGWMLIFFSIGLLFWILVHLAIMTPFIMTLRVSIIDISLYLAVHIFYLLAWLFQMDMGDSGQAYWAVQRAFDLPALDPFIKQWADTIFWDALTGTLVCYFLIMILLIVKLVMFIRSRKKAAPAPVIAA